MTRNRIVNIGTIATCLAFLTAVPGLARGDSAVQHPAQTSSPALPGPQKVASIEDDFAGLDLTDDQKSEIEKIRQATESHKSVVANAPNLNSDQKSAMIQGYARLEYTQIFRTLTPLQQKIVRKRISDRRAADQAKKGPQAPKR